MNETPRIAWPMLALAVLCLLPVLGGLALLLGGGDGAEALGWALIGFFGSGVYVLGRRAFTP